MQCSNILIFVFFVLKIRRGFYIKECSLEIKFKLDFFLITHPLTKNDTSKSGKVQS